MLRSFRQILLCASAVAVTSCATIISGDSQTVWVETVGVDGANCTLTDTKGNISTVQTPAQTLVNRGDGPLTVSCEKPGVGSAETVHPESLNPWVFGNIVLGGFIGMGIDLATGAYQGYDEKLQVSLNPSTAGLGTPGLGSSSPSTLLAEEGAAPPPLLGRPLEPTPSGTATGLTEAEQMLQEARAALSAPVSSGPASPGIFNVREPAPAPILGSAAPSGPFAVQVGAFSVDRNAQTVIARAVASGFPTFTRPQRRLTAVRLGPYPSRDAAQEAARAYRLAVGGEAVVVRN